MIRYNVRQLLDKKCRLEDRKISLSSVAKEIGIQRAAMSKIAQDNGYTTTTATIEALCDYFKCEVHELIWLDKEK